MLSCACSSHRHRLCIERLYTRVARDSCIGLDCAQEFLHKADLNEKNVVTVLSGLKEVRPTIGMGNMCCRIVSEGQIESGGVTTCPCSGLSTILLITATFHRCSAMMAWPRCPSRSSCWCGPGCAPPLKPSARSCHTPGDLLGPSRDKAVFCCSSAIAAVCHWSCDCEV